MMRSESARLILLATPAGIVLLTFFLAPLGQLIVVGATGEAGLANYTSIVTNSRHLTSMVATVTLAVLVTVSALAIATVAGLFLVRHRFSGRNLLVAALTLPLAFPGVVIGFLVILLAGRQGLLGAVSEAVTGNDIVLAYSIGGLYLGYLYFSIPRVILTVMAQAEMLDPAREEAARSLGAPTWRVVVDVVLPGLKPGLISAGSICFATAMGAFGTAFTLATDIDVLPMTIYTEFTLNANFASAASLSVVLGGVTWGALLIARRVSDTTVVTGG